MARPAGFLPPSATPAAALVLWSRGLRAFADGFVSLLLPLYLTRIGYDPFQVGSVLTATLLGSAVATLLVGTLAHRLELRLALLGAAILMAATGLGFAGVENFWPLLIVAAVGTLNPSTGDVSLFLPLEHALLAHAVADRDRTAMFARYSFAGSLVGAVGSLAAALPQFAVDMAGLDLTAAIKGMFVLYALIGAANWIIYQRLPRRHETGTAAPSAPLTQSRGIVMKLAALFSLDAFGGGLFVQSLLALWLFQRFGLSIAAASAIFFWSNLAAAVSYMAATRLAARIGLINTMVFTHLPSNVCIMLVPFAPSLAIAIALIVVRSLLSQMDVPTRTSYVMAVVTPPERPAAAGMTAVPRSLAGALGPLLGGWMLGLSPFGWPLVLGGVLKAVYDLALLAAFRSVKPPEEN
ncbi:MAG TPA: MFS transporter [Candidatus Cybelea sp.]|nr:MFS transporter [Candidatus Cybelea sp.]